MRLIVRKRLRRLAFNGLPPGSLAAYGFSCICVGVAALTHIAFAHFIENVTPSVPYYPAIFVAALLGGVRAGIVALVLSTLLAWWGFDSQYFGLHPSEVTIEVNRGLFVLAGGVIVWIAECFRRAGSRQRPPARSTTARPAVGGILRLYRSGLRPNSPAAIVFALVCVGIATLVRMGSAWFGEGVLPFVSYYPAILIASLIGGMSAGFVALGLSILIVAWAFFPPYYSFGPVSSEEIISFGLYLFGAIFTVWLAESYRRTIRRHHTYENAILDFIEPVVLSFGAVLLTTIVLLMLSSKLEGQHLVIGYLLPMTLIAMQYGSTFALLTSFTSAIAAAYFLFPPKFSLYVTNPLHLAELGFFILLAVIASKVVAVLTYEVEMQEGGTNQPGNRQLPLREPPI